MNTLRRGPLTRSKVNCRQTQLLDRFARTGARSALRTSLLRDRDSAGPLLKCLLLTVLSVFVGIFMG